MTIYEVLVVSEKDLRSLIKVFNKLTSRQALNHANEISDIILLYIKRDDIYM